MNINLRQAFKATLFSIIVALFIVMAIVISFNLFLGQEIDDLYLVINKMSITTENEENLIKARKAYESAIIEDESKTLTSYPSYGSQYATIKIDRIDVDLPVFFGSTLDILKNGVGHDSGSYFPGEGGSIIYMGHNSKNVFRRFSELQINDKIIVNTSYGEFRYRIYDMQLIKETEFDKLPIQKDKEILMVYTCYPFNNIGYATQRYVVYAELEKGNEV